MQRAIAGIGLDIVELVRFGRIYEQHGERFVLKFCRPGEWNTRRREASLIQHLAGLFAAKEAVLKALGTGWSQGLSFRQVEVVKDDLGSPAIRLHGNALRHAARHGLGHIHLSITHERAYAVAMAVIENPPRQKAPESNANEA